MSCSSQPTAGGAGGRIRAAVVSRAAVVAVDPSLAEEGVVPWPAEQDVVTCQSRSESRGACESPQRAVVTIPCNEPVVARTAAARRPCRPPTKHVGARPTPQHVVAARCEAHLMTLSPRAGQHLVTGSSRAACPGRARPRARRHVRPTVGVDEVADAPELVAPAALPPRSRAIGLSGPHQPSGSGPLPPPYPISPSPDDGMRVGRLTHADTVVPSVRLHVVVARACPDDIWSPSVPRSTSLPAVPTMVAGCPRQVGSVGARGRSRDGGGQAERHAAGAGRRRFMTWAPRVGRPSRTKDAAAGHRVRRTRVGRMPGVPPARYAYLGPEGTFAEAAAAHAAGGGQGRPAAAASASPPRSTPSAAARPTTRWCRSRTPSRARCRRPSTSWRSATR